MKYLKILYVQVLIGIILGIFVGWLFPSFSDIAKLIADTYIHLIMMVIAPVIFFTIVIGLSGAGEIRKMGRIGGKGLLYFEVVTLFALVIGLYVANFIKPGVGVSQEHLNSVLDFNAQPEAAMDWGQFISDIVPSNAIEAFAKGNIMQILFFGILFGLALTKIGKTGDLVFVFFDKINKVLFNILHMVVMVSPIGAFGGMAYSIGAFGFSSVALLGKLMLTFYITGALFVFVVLGLIARAYGFNLWKLMGYLKTEILIVWGTSSSEVVLPNLMEKLEKAGCSKQVVGVMVPAGYSFNLDGTCIYLSMATIFLAQVFNLHLTIVHELTIIGVLLITSHGAAGVTGSGFLVLTSTLAALKIIPLEGLGLLIGVDRFMSEGRAIVNVIGNSLASLVIAKSENAMDMEKYMRVVERREAKISGPDG